MVKIEDRTTKHFKSLVEDALKLVYTVLPKEDLIGIDKILLLDKCSDEEYEWAGGFYCSARNDNLAYIELYPPKIINAKPFFLPKTKFSKEYSIIKMFLHELGHHKCGVRDIQTREIEAEKYMTLYLRKLYGNWIYFFDSMGRIDAAIRGKPNVRNFKKE